MRHARIGAADCPADKDGRRDLVVALDLRRRFADATFQQQCAAHLSGANTPSPFDGVKPVRLVVPLLFDGTRFTPEARALARLMQAQATVDKNGKPPPP